MQRDHGRKFVCVYWLSIVYCNWNVLGRSNPAAVSFPRKGVSEHDRSWRDPVFGRRHRLHSRDSKKVTAHSAKWAVIWKNNSASLERCRHRTFLSVFIITGAHFLDKRELQNEVRTQNRVAVFDYRATSFSFSTRLILLIGRPQPFVQFHLAFYSGLPSL